MTFLQVQEMLSSIERNSGMNLGLLRMRALMKALGNPQQSVPAVHIAGTNGKGSVSMFLTKILKAAGQHVGTYTSPAVFSMTEQYGINGSPIDEDRLTEVFAKVFAAAGQIRETVGESTRFELETAAAFLLFFEEQCTINIIECGLGGDEDATNVLEDPLLCCVTPISLDHTRILGKTLTEIAGHKAGIFYKGRPVVSAPQACEAMEVLRTKAGELMCPFVVADPERMDWKTDGKRAWIKTAGFPELIINTPAVYQKTNLSVALSAVQTLRDLGIAISDDAVLTGCANFFWPGRFEVLDGSPRFVFDGAHNPAGAKALHDSLQSAFPGETPVYILAMFADKDVSGALRALFTGVESPHVFTVRSNNPRAMEADRLASFVRTAAPDARVVACDSVEQACKMAAETGNTVCVCGTLSVQARAKEWRKFNG